MTGFVRNVQVNNIQEALEEIRDLLVAQAWEIHSGSPNSYPFVLKSPIIVNGYRPWLRYTNPTGTTLRLQGDFDGSGTHLSTARDSILGVGSRIWLAADSEAMCQYIKPATANGDAFHAGALDRLSPTDGSAIQVGLLSNSNSTGLAQTAERFNSTTKWDNSDAGCGLFANIYTGAINTSSILLMPVTGTPQLTSYFRFNNTDKFRGEVKFAVTGLAGATAGTEFEIINPDTLTVEKVYVSSGAGGFLVYDATA